MMMPPIFKHLINPLKILLLILSCAVFISLNGCIQDVIDSGKNADYDPENVSGVPDTLEKRGLAVPEIIDITPKDKYLGPECKITVIFNEKMNRTSVEERFRIYNSKDYPFEGKFIWGSILNTDKQYFDFIPVKQLITDDYKVILLEGSTSISNMKMTGRFTSKFTFMPIPEENSNN